MSTDEPASEGALAAVTAWPVSIGQAARLSGISPKMLRHYESLSLLGAVHRTENNYRQYSLADVHTLLDIYEHMVLLDDQTLEVFCHLDYDGPHATVLSRRGQRAELTVIPKIERAVAIRAPRWTPVESIRVRVGGDLVHPVYAGHFARLGRQPAGTRIVMEYDLPERRTRETDLGSPYEIAWRGDEVTGVRPNTTLYPFYPELR